MTGGSWGVILGAGTRTIGYHGRRQALQVARHADARSGAAACHLTAIRLPPSAAPPTPRALASWGELAGSIALDQALDHHGGNSWACNAGPLPFCPAGDAEQ